ncbi:MAG: sigma-70 family RNA polymerase sigma factor [Desulfomonilaceae bacterium]|nr:sigma-70 family RNA polymerase sigma factor [Desulfomonilaceae bacterium]
MMMDLTIRFNGLELVGAVVDSVEKECYSDGRSGNQIDFQGDVRLMDHQPQTDDRTLVEHCLAGSKTAWDEFYGRFIPLVRKVARMHTRDRGGDLQDAIQDVFLSLFTSLGRFDSQYPLSRFVWTVAERVCIDRHRRETTVKRTGDTVPVDHHDGGAEGSTMVRSNTDLPEESVAKSELVALLRLVFRDLGWKCREVLRLRYLEDLSFKDVSRILGIGEKTLSVQTGRCIDELRMRYLRAERKGRQP